MKSFAFAMKGLAGIGAILCLALPSLAAAQAGNVPKKSGAGVHKLLAVKATGSTRYDDKEILAASGLELGQNAGDADFSEAAQRLGNSGLFADILYSFSYTDAGVKLDFQLTDIDKAKLVPAHFENFVWFTESELRASLAQRVPLFKEVLPASGRLTEQITTALQALLAERRFPGRVSYLREGKPDGGNITGIVYRVEDLTIRIRNVEFPGASPEQTAFLANGARKLTGGDYFRSAIAVVARYDLLPLFLQRGYLKAAFGPADARVVAPSSGKVAGQAQAEAEDKPSDELVVDAMIPVTPGKQYLVSDESWKGNAAVTTEEASPLLHLGPGQPADAVRLGRDVEALAKLYRSRGYMAVQIKPDPQMDDEKSTVRYVIDVAEGDVYTMGELEFLGVDTPSKDRLREAWTLREGQPYNADYASKFLEGAPRLLPKELRYSVKVSEELSAKDKTVDVTIRFTSQ
jgi:outer membrane protein assembly factor BamA